MALGVRGLVPKRSCELLPIFLVDPQDKSYIIKDYSRGLYYSCVVWCIIDIALVSFRLLVTYARQKRDVAVLTAVAHTGTIGRCADPLG